jgi:DNA-binding response OmpR family regulator/anti-sigma regulatory factor (Ser/Thr protein kinase)
MPREDMSMILAMISDQNLTRELNKLLLGSSFELHVAPTAHTGLQMAEELLPDAILVDIDLDGSGLDICRRLRANRMLRGLPILLLCSSNDHDARALGLAAGADDFISKPFDAIELLARLRTVIRLNAKRLMVTDLARFNWMASHAEGGYVLLDKSGAIHYANENAQVLLNLPEDYLGLPFIAVVEHRFKPEPHEAWSNWINEPVPLFLIQPETPTARVVWVMLDALDTSLGAEQHRIVHLKDVTERMSIYQDMRRFHTVVAHKLRTPISMLVSSVALIKSRLDQLSTEELKELVRSSLKGIDRLASQVQEILTYIDAPLALNVSEPVALEVLPKIVRTICEPLRMRDVVVSVPDKLRSKVVALTHDALEIILYELLLNARKFHPDKNPTVEIAVEEIDEDYIRVRVADDGQTLSIEQLSWAWLPYMQGEKDFTGELPGMGLGFPMVATLLWKVGGGIQLRNRHNGPGVIVEMKVPLESTVRRFERSAAPYPG